MNLLQLLKQRVDLHPRKTCLQYKQGGTWESLTYDQFWNAVMSFSEGLRQIGVQTGDKVAILSNNRPEWAIADYGTLAIGAVVAPIYPTLPADQVHYILANAEACVCVVEDQTQLAKIEADWPPGLHSVILLQALTDGVPGDGRNENACPQGTCYRFDELLAFGSEALAVGTSHGLHIPDDAVATIVHTSGTSGPPKGVVLTHKNLVSNVQASLQMVPVRDDDIGLSYLPLSHIFERTVGQFTSLSSGGTIAYAESIETIPQNMLEIRPTILVTVPRLLEKVYSKITEQLSKAPPPLRQWLRTGLQKDKNTGFTYRLVERLVYRKVRAGMGGRVRLIVSGGAALGAEVGRFFERAGLPVHEGYGMTESSPVIAVNPWGAARIGTVGVPVPGVEVRIAPDGELLVRGPNVMVGYYNNPEETAKALVDGWLHTGDVGELDGEYVRIVDRKKNILVLATGKNVAPAPIESAIMMSAYVSSAVVLGDGRRYVTCLVSPDLASLRPVAERLGLGDDPKVWIEHPEIRRLFTQEIADRIGGFADFEKPKRAVLTAEEFSIESGELTPSLKVRNKYIRDKYGTQIEDMYAGRKYLPIVPLRDQPQEDAPSSETLPMVPAAQTEGGKRRRKYSQSQVAAVTIVSLLVLGAAGALALPHLPKNLDVLGTVKHINNTNGDISDENQKIVQNLQHIDNLADATQNMANGLTKLKAGVAADTSSLGTLRDLSQQEVDLSRQFLQLAKSLHTDLGTIGSASKDQQATLASMVSTAHSVSGTAGSVVTVNRQVSSQLSSADGKARTVAEEMP